MSRLKPDGITGVGEILVSRDEIARRVEEIGEQITNDYKGCTPLIVTILKGAVFFGADLIRAIDLPVDIDFMSVSSYATGTTSSGVVRIIKDIDVDISGKHVILVEDIVDSGLTLGYLRKSMESRNPASLAACVLVQREHNKGKAEMPPIKYIGFTLPKVWLVGAGLDISQHFRNLPDIRAFDENANSKTKEKPSINRTRMLYAGDQEK